MRLGEWSATPGGQACWIRAGWYLIGATHHQVPQTIGPLVFAAALLIAARLLAGRTSASGRIRPTSL
ncbi:hypothetical protein [Streptomyces natalensis]|uniref:Uncharacterized protein n=1 Tax=Streptomyces natalensis ATCC 27448 TaxID=1240678 RepID=A0A0D7CJY7_9ACTN|nr:hypothetical protein [Streptomyces natalensis]KIZ16549.1 hypothetical protein SNA_19780 [Streptomyces natalensis ATCC 27448]